jgi:hypothetical protein
MDAGMKVEEQSSYQEVRGGGEGKRRELLSCKGVWRLGFGEGGTRERGKGFVTGKWDQI